MARAGVAITESFGDLLTPGLRKIYSDTFDSKPEMRPMLYNVASSSTSYEKTSSLGAFGDIQPFKGVIQYDDFSQGYDVTFSHIQLANGFKVERQLFDDDLKCRGRNLAICKDEPKAFYTDKVIIKRMKQCVNLQERFVM